MALKSPQDLSKVCVCVSIPVAAPSMEPPIERFTGYRIALERIDAVYQAILPAEPGNQVVAPVASARLPRKHPAVALNALKELVEITNILPCGQKGSRTLKHHHTCIDQSRDFPRTLPRQRHLLCRPKAAVQVPLGIADAGFQTPVRRAGRRVRNQLPGFHAELKALRRQRLPSPRNGIGRRLIERSLYLYSAKRGNVFRLRLGPAATPHRQRRGQSFFGPLVF